MLNQKVSRFINLWIFFHMATKADFDHIPPSFVLLNLKRQENNWDQAISIPNPVKLVDHEAVKRAHAERAVDKLRDKFGNKSVELGLTFTNKRAKK